MENQVVAAKPRKQRVAKKLLPSQHRKDRRFYVYVDEATYSTFQKLMVATAQAEAACGRLVFARGLRILAGEWNVAA